MIRTALGLSLMVCTALCVGPTPSPDACKAHPNGLIADPANTHQFYQCAHGRISGQAVPCGKDAKTGQQLTFNEKDQTCEGGGGANCPSPDGVFPYPGDQHKFIQCTNGQGAVMDCGPILIFLDKCKICTYEDDPCTGPITNPPTVAPPVTTAAPPATTAAPPATTAAPPATTAAPPATTAAPPATTAAAVECTKDRETFPDPADPHGFYICKNGKKVHGTCPDNGNFDPATHGCA